MSDIFSTSFRSGRPNRTRCWQSRHRYLSFVSSGIQDFSLCFTVTKAVSISQENLNTKLTLFRFYFKQAKRFHRFVCLKTKYLFQRTKLAKPTDTILYDKGFSKSFEIWSGGRFIPTHKGWGFLSPIL